MTSTVPTTDETEIRELLTALEPAMREGDAERVVARYSPDAVKFDLAPPLRLSGAEVTDAEGLRKWFAEKGGSVDYRVTDLVVTAGADIAYAHSLNRMADPAPDGSPRFELWFRATYCLRKRDGRWLITHEHNSTPFYMDGSFAAALDLRP
ncbi:MAG TPA: SgcJ/EcaC family oxidoreductase [Mycobacteriales bacterium]|nr:SgcJ/EcaC family oxidoreductase [Mycobacteriales bacterium]